MRKLGTTPIEDDQAPLEPIGTYIDEEGRTVTVYPARYLEGGGRQPFTARSSSRGRRSRE